MKNGPLAGPFSFGNGRALNLRREQVQPQPPRRGSVGTGGKTTRAPRAVNPAPATTTICCRAPAAAIESGDQNGLTRVLLYRAMNRAYQRRCRHFNPTNLLGRDRARPIRAAHASHRAGRGFQGGSARRGSRHRLNRRGRRSVFVRPRSATRLRMRSVRPQRPAIRPR